MNRPQHHQDIADIEILRLENGMIDYAAYDLRARKERAKAFHAVASSLVQFVRSGLTGISGVVVGLKKAVSKGARKYDPAGLQIGRKFPKPLGS